MASLAERIAAARNPRPSGPAPLAALSADPVARRRIQAEVERLAFDALGRTGPDAPESPAAFDQRRQDVLLGLASAGVPDEQLREAARSMVRLGQPLLTERQIEEQRAQRAEAEQAFAAAQASRAAVFADLALAAERGNRQAASALADEWLEAVRQQPEGAAALSGLAARAQAMLNLRRQEQHHARQVQIAERLAQRRNLDLAREWLAGQQDSLDDIAGNPDVDAAYRSDALAQRVLDLADPATGGQLARQMDPAAFERLRRRAQVLAQRAAGQANAETRRRFSAELRDTMADRQAEAIAEAQARALQGGAAASRWMGPPEP